MFQVRYASIRTWLERTKGPYYSDRRGDRDRGHTSGL